MKHNKYLFLFYIFIFFAFSCKELKKAIRDSVHKRRPNTLTRHQKCLKHLFQKIISKDNSVNEDSNYGIVNDEEDLGCGNLQNKSDVLTDEEKNTVLRSVEETQENMESEDYAQCVGCYGWYDKNVLFKYEHTRDINQAEDPQLPHFHYATCYDCEQKYADLHPATKCAYCRRPSRKKFPRYLIDRNLVATRIYDDSCLAMMISSGTMYILSAFGIQDEKMSVIQRFNMITWYYLWFVSGMFVSHVEKSVSILFDNRGLSFLLFPIMYTIIAIYDVEIGSYISMATLLSIFLQLLSTKKSFIISDRFYQYLSYFPEKCCCMTERDLQMGQFRGMARIKDFFFNLCFYIILWGTIATAKNHDRVCPVSNGKFEAFEGEFWYDDVALYLCPTVDAIMGVGTGFIVFSSITIFILFLFKMTYTCVEKKSFLTYNQGLWVLVIGFIMNLSTGTENGFMIANMFLMLEMFVAYMFICIFLILCMFYHFMKYLCR